MAQTDKERLFELIKLMNRCRHEYYNLNASTVSDEVYDRLFDELVSLQTKTNIYMANSPTMAPGYPPVSKLEKVNHTIPTQACTMFPLLKTRSLPLAVGCSSASGI